MATFAPAGASLPPGGLNFLLLGCARDPDAPETRALARAIALTWGWPLGPASGVLGLPETDSRALFDQHFPGALALLTGVHALGARGEPIGSSHLGRERAARCGASHDERRHGLISILSEWTAQLFTALA